MTGSIEKRGKGSYRLVVSTGKNLDSFRARREKKQESAFSCDSS